MPFQPFNPGAEVQTYRNHLPHWRQAGATYFVTARLADALPASKLRQWAQERLSWFQIHGFDSEIPLEALPASLRKEYHSRFTKEFEDWLDAGSGAC